MRREELRVTKIVNAPTPLKKSTPEFLVAISVTQVSHGLTQDDHSDQQ
jgi:hypothetical protein